MSMKRLAVAAAVTVLGFGLAGCVDGGPYYGDYVYSGYYGPNYYDPYYGGVYYGGYYGGGYYRHRYRHHGDHHHHHGGPYASQSGRSYHATRYRPNASSYGGHTSLHSTNRASVRGGNNELRP